MRESFFYRYEVKIYDTGIPQLAQFETQPAVFEGQCVGTYDANVGVETVRIRLHGIGDAQGLTLESIGEAESGVCHYTLLINEGFLNKAE